MWSAIINFFAHLITRMSRNDNKETWTHLEMRHNINLESLEELKKLRIKNF